MLSPFKLIKRKKFKFFFNWFSIDTIDLFLIYFFSEIKHFKTNFFQFISLIPNTLSGVEEKQKSTSVCELWAHLQLWKKTMNSKTRKTHLIQIKHKPLQVVDSDTETKNLILLQTMSANKISNFLST